MVVFGLKFEVTNDFDQDLYRALLDFRCNVWPLCFWNYFTTFFYFISDTDIENDDDEEDDEIVPGEFIMASVMTAQGDDKEYLADVILSLICCMIF